MSGSVFAEKANEIYKHRWAGQLLVHELHGGTPTDEKVAEGWLKTKLAAKDDLLRELVATTMAERGITAEQAISEADTLRHLNGFKRDVDGLYIEGRQLKACIKEAVNVAVAAGHLSKTGWGKTNKGSAGFIAEHVVVVENRLYLGVEAASGVHQRFVHTWRGTGIQYEEFVTDAKLSFTVQSDHKFDEKFWSTVWITAEQQGVGASRSMGFGRFEVTAWDQI